MVSLQPRCQLLFSGELSKLLKTAKKENAGLFFENSRLRVELTKKTDVLEEKIKHLEAELVINFEAHFLALSSTRLAAALSYSR